MSWQDPYYTEYLKSIREASGGNPAGIVRELVLAYNERCAACGMDNDTGGDTDLTLAVPSDGDTALHYQGLFKQLQDGMDSLIGSGRWWNHDSYSSGTFATLTNAAWRTLAGLPASIGNYRRVTGFTSDDFTQPIFGTAEAIAEDDYFGPWIIEDIQDGLDHMRFARPLKISAIDRVGRGISGSSPVADGLADAKTKACGEFAAASNVLLGALESDPYPFSFDFSGAGLSSAPDENALTGTRLYAPLDDYEYYLGNQRVKIKVDAPSGALSKTIEVWGSGSKWLQAGTYNPGSWPISATAGVLTKFVDEVISGTSHTTGNLGNTAFNCPVDEVGWGSQGESLSADGIRAISTRTVIKWDFTNRSYTI